MTILICTIVIISTISIWLAIYYKSKLKKQEELILFYKNLFKKSSKIASEDMPKILEENRNLSRINEELSLKLNREQASKKKIDITNNNLPKYKKRVLIIDYIAYSALQTENVFLMFGFDSEIILDSDKALGKIKEKGQYDLIVTNCEFRADSINGDTLIRELFEIKDWNIPIILLDNQDVIENCNNTRISELVSDMIEKPLNVEKLKKILERIFKK